MADLSDVSNTLANVIRDAFYPNGTSNPSVVPSVGTIRVYPGWPTPKNLENDLPLNNVHVTVWPLPTNRNTTRFREDWVTNFINDPSLEIIISGSHATITGTNDGSKQTCVIIMNNIGYAYTVQSGDTVNTIAQALAALIPSASAVANVITIPAAFSLIGRVTVTGESIMEFKRQQQLFQVSLWTVSYVARAACAPIIDKSIGFLKRFVLPDNFFAAINHMHTKEFDQFDKTPVYRRDLVYQIEYATTQTEIDYTITDPYANITIENSIQE